MSEESPSLSKAAPSAPSAWAHLARQIVTIIVFSAAAWMAWIQWEKFRNSDPSFVEPEVHITGPDGILTVQHKILRQHSSPSSRYIVCRFKGPDPIGPRPSSVGILVNLAEMLQRAHRELRMPPEDTPDLKGVPYKIAFIQSGRALVIYHAATEQGWIYVTLP